MFQNAAIQWIVRRLMEVGGVVGAIAYAYAQLSPELQATIGRLFSRSWEQVTLGDIKPLVLLLGGSLWGYIWSFRASTKSHAVDDGKIVPKKSLPKGVQVELEDGVQQAVQRSPGIGDALGGLLNWFKR